MAGGLRDGAVVGRFRLTRRLGSGGQADVYLGRDLELGRLVAIKVLRGDRREGDEERLKQEARAAARISHPNVATIHEIGEHQGQTYLVLEYVEGKTVREALGAGPLPRGEALRIGRDIAAGLAAAHAQGVAHLDLSPRNVMLGVDGRLRILDFGLARLVAAQRQGAEAFAGTPRYMAPEQWMGAELGPGADVWALAVLVHELLTGTTPLADVSLALLRHRVCEPGPLPLADAMEALAAPLRDLIRQCLAKSAGKRPGAADVAAQLSAILDGGPLAADLPPFRGLLPLDERHAGLFFGRDDEIAVFLEGFDEAPVHTIVAPSGAGKSSLVHAGLAPRLRERGWALISFRPGRDPLRSLATAWTEVDNAADPDELVARWRSSPGLLGLDLGELAAAIDQPVCVAVDQLEELVTLSAKEAQTTGAAALAHAAGDRAGPVRVVQTLRDDHVGRVSALSPDPLLGRVFVLPPPGDAALREMIARPVQAAGYRFEDPEMIDEMVASVRAESAALSLLQFAGSALWERRDPKRRLLLRAEYDALGGVPGALAVHGDRLLGGASADEVVAARGLLLRLVAPDGTRRPMARAHLLDGLGPAATPALEMLIDARLVTTRRLAGEPHAELELAHEAVAARWQTLAGWLDESRGERAALEEVHMAATIWSQRNRPADQLWRGDALAEAHRRIERAAIPVPELTRDFVQASIGRQRRRIWLRRLTVGAVLLVLAGIGVVLNVQRRDAREQAALAQRRAADALVEAGWSALVEGRIAEARALARAAIETELTPRARGLWWRLGLEPELWRARLNIAGTDVAWSPDAHSAIVTGWTFTVYRLDARTGALRTLGKHEDIVLSAAASPRGVAATGGADHMVRLWSFDGEPGPSFSHTAPVTALAFSREGSQLAAADAAGHLIVRAIPSGRVLWRARSKQPIARLAFAGSGVATVDTAGAAHLLGRDQKIVTLLAAEAQAVAVSPNGERLAVGTSSGELLLIAPDGSKIDAWPAHARPIVAVEWAGDTLLTASVDGTARTWRPGRREPVRQLQAGAALRTARLSPDGELAAAITAEARIIGWRIAAARLPPHSGFDGPVNQVAFADGGATIVGAAADGWLRAFDVASARQVAAVRASRGSTNAVAATSDGAMIASGGDDATVRLWRGGRLIAAGTLTGHRAPVLALAFNEPGGAVISGSQDGTARRWPLGGGPPTVYRAGAPIIALVAAPKVKRLLALTEDRRLVSWPLSGGEPTVMRKLDGNTPGLVLDPKGTRIAILGEPPQQILDLVSGAERRLDFGQSRLYGGAFSPTGDRLMTYGAGGWAAVVDLEGKTHVTLGEHRWDILAAVYSPDGETIATAGEDGLAGVWRARDGQLSWGPVATVPPLDPSTPERGPPTRRLLVDAFTITGHADGRVVVAGAAGRNLLVHRLHGAIDRLTRRGDSVVAGSVTGQRVIIPVAGLSLTGCRLLEDVWRQAPLVWSDGAAVPAAPPRSHRCR